MRIAIVSGGDGWHVRDLQRAAAPLGNETRLIDFRRVHAGIAATADAFADSATVLVRTMPQVPWNKWFFGWTCCTGCKPAAYRS